MMNYEQDFQKIYQSMTGQLKQEHRVPWVPNAWKEDTGFKRAYEDFWTAREHLCHRFGIDWEDPDLELFMNGSMDLEEDVCRRMFLYALEYAKRGYQL